MEIVQNAQIGAGIQMGLWDSIIDLLLPGTAFLLGIVIIVIVLVIMFKKDKYIPKLKVSIFSILMYYYLCLTFTNIVGIPTISEFNRLSGLGESFFNPNINLIPLSDGFSISFVLNIFLFIPFGFLCPMISGTYERAKYTVLLGMGLSLSIEIAQLFTLYRASDVNDLLTNVLGTVIGYLCFRLAARQRIVKSYYNQQSRRKDFSRHLPIFIIVVAFTIEFLN